MEIRGNARQPEQESSTHLTNPDSVQREHKHASSGDKLASGMDLLSLKEQVLSAKSEVSRLEKELAEEIARKSGKKMSIAQIKDEDDKMLLYTSLHYDVFHILLSTLERFQLNYYAGWPVRSLSLEDQLLLTLMKLTLNVSDLDLACRFHVSRATVSNIVITLVTALHEFFFEAVLRHAVPSLRKCQDCIPKSFGEFASGRMAVDVIEVSLGVPEKLSKQGASDGTWESRRTAKAVTCVAPNGAIVYASDLYPGSSPDTDIVARSGLLSHLKEGDVILAGEGLIARDLLPPGVTIKDPRILIGSSSFTYDEANVRREVTWAWIHKRISERIKRFEILTHIPADYISFSTKIFQLCCSLVNFHDPLLKEFSEK